MPGLTRRLLCCTLALLSAFVLVGVGAAFQNKDAPLTFTEHLIADKYGYPRYVANQTYYSLISRDYEWELMPLGLEEGIGAVIWSPLGWGRLTGKIRRGTGIPKDSRLTDSAEFGVAAVS